MSVQDRIIDGYKKNDISNVDDVLIDAFANNHYDILEWLTSKVHQCTGISELVSKCTWSHVASRAALGGYLDIVKHCETKGKLDWSEVVKCAVSGNCMNIVRYCVSKQSGLGRTIANTAAYYGHLHTIKYADSLKESISWWYVAREAARGGHLDIVKKARDLAKYWSWFHIRYEAAYGGHIDVYEYANSMEEYKLSYDDCVGSAANSGHMKFVVHCVSNGAKDYNSIAIEAAKCAHIDTLKYIICIGAKNYNDIAYTAADSGHLDIVKYIVSTFGITNHHDVAVIACKGGYLDIIKYIDTYGKIDYVVLLRTATLYKHTHIIDYINTKIPT